MKNRLLPISLALFTAIFSVCAVCGNRNTGSPGAWTYTRITEQNISRAVKQLPQIVETARAATGIPGIAVAVVRADDVLLARGFGVREAGKPEPVNADTVFQLASLSKPVGATVISRAVSDQSVSWDDPVVKYLPWFRIGSSFVTDNVTIGDLYAHRSGLPSHAGDLLEDLGFDRAHILRQLRLVPTGPFRNQYAYTNFGLTAAAEAVAAAHNKRWEQLSDELLYRPAGMVHTSSRYSDYLSASNRAVTHQRQGDNWVPGPPRDPQQQSPAGGVSSSANDMAIFLRLHLGNGSLNDVELIKPDKLQQMRQPHSISGISTNPLARTSSYGYGMITSVDGTGHVRWSHSGAFLLGTGTSLAIIPGGDIAIVVLTNGEPLGVAESIVAQFIDIVETGEIQQDWLSLYHSVFAREFENDSVLANQERPLNPTGSFPLDDYAGTYLNDYYGPARVTIENNQLVISLGQVPYKFQLSHWNGNVFSYLPTGENAVGISAVSFDRHSRSMTVEQLDRFGLGTFIRSTTMASGNNERQLPI